jgi:hypothetical protein
MNQTMKKSLYLLLPTAVTPIIPIINGTNYPIIFFAIFAMSSAYFMTREEGENNRVKLASTVYITLYLSAVVILTSWISQPPVNLNGGLGWDGIHYASLYERFLLGTSQLPLSSPFHQRIALPYLASRLPLEPRSAFYILHSLFWVGTMVFFTLTCRRGFNVPHSLTILGVIWLQIHWIAVPRASASYSYTVDSAAIFFMAALSYFFITRHNSILIIVTALVGAFFKETILLWCICLAFGSFFIKNREERKKLIFTMLIAIIASALANMYCKNIFPTESSTGNIATLVYWVKLRALYPGEYKRYISAIFNASGGFFIIFLSLVIEYSRDKERKYPYRPELLAATAYIVICFFAGSDLTKFAFMSFPLMLPVILSLVVNYIDRLKYWWAILLVALGLPTARILEPLLSPLPGHELPNMDATGPYTWMMEYAHPFLVTSWILWCCVIFIIARATFRFAKVRP